MKKFFMLMFVLFPVWAISQDFTTQEISTWKKQAQNISIIRDNYGIPHIYGKTDADAVFGLLYAQCEDDFPRVEMNYIEKLGRLSEVNGEKDLYDDLLIRLVIDSSDAIKDYMSAPGWLKELCDAFAAGVNFYLATHPEVKPKLLHKFQPWYPMLWTDGSIGAITTAGFGARDLKNFYTGETVVSTSNNFEEKPTGSNGFAFAPSITKNKNAILYINPHVTFYFRPEVHVNSDEGLNAYGAVTWGQFFVYQGFNEHCGWMHTSSYADVSDAYIEDVFMKDGSHYYRYNGRDYPVLEKNYLINYRQGDSMIEKHFTGYFTVHGPVLGTQNGKWISVCSNNRDRKGLIQSWQRTKAKSFADYKKTMDLLANASNNTVYADSEGNIAYWHGNFIPKRDSKYDWNKPVDGTTALTQWKGFHTVEESIHIYNPKNGWLENCNSTPFTAAGPFSPKPKDYPTYMAPDGQNFRGLNAIKILPNENQYTLEKVIEKGYNTYLTAFDILIPALERAYNNAGNENDSALNKAFTILKSWNREVSENSVATTLAIYWGEKLLPSIYLTQIKDGETDDIVEKTKKFAQVADGLLLMNQLKSVLTDLTKSFGTWNIQWGDVNRFQRINDDIRNSFNDSMPSYPVAYTASVWGMLPAYNSRTFDGTVKRYGVSGNSFICAVEFGKKIKAKSLLAGGESGHADSKHFFDQGYMYSKGIFKDVLFYKEDVLKHAQKTYHPGYKY